MLNPGLSVWRIYMRKVSNRNKSYLNFKRILEKQNQEGLKDCKINFNLRFKDLIIEINLWL